MNLALGILGVVGVIGLLVWLMVRFARESEQAKGERDAERAKNRVMLAFTKRTVAKNAEELRARRRRRLGLDDPE
jgi:hypothetical protein